MKEETKECFPPKKNSEALDTGWVLSGWIVWENNDGLLGKESYI